MLTILADAFLTASRHERETRHANRRDWAAPKHWTRPPADRARHLLWRGDYDD